MTSRDDDDLPAECTPVVRLTDPGSVVQAVPVVIGFPPVESLVVLSIGPEPRRIGLTLRGDLAACWLDVDFVPRTAEVLARNGAHAALLVVFTEQPPDPVDPSQLPWSDLVGALADELERAGLEVREQLLVRDGRWSSYSCRGACCPAEGTPVPTGTSALQAQAVLEGRVLLPDREALAATVAGPEPGSPRAEELLWRLVDAEQELVEDICLHPGLVEEHLRGLPARFRSLMLRPLSASEPELLDLIVALDSRAARDEVLGSLRDADLGAAVLLLSQLLRLAVPPWTVVPATMLAHCSWRAGGGALTNIALDRVFADDPGNALAAYLAQAMRYGLRAEPEHGVRDPGLEPPERRAG